MITHAITTAVIMMTRSCAMPIAVMMESSENTISMTMICAITQRTRWRPPLLSLPASPPFHLAVNFVGCFRDQEQPAADQDDVAPRQWQAANGDDSLGQADQPHQQA